MSEAVNIQIRHWLTDTVLFECSVDATLPHARRVKVAVLKAIAAGADLSDANLSDANLSDADLRGADLSAFVIPALPNIDAAILAAIESGGELDMREWHVCETTHCRAGWAITLAGDAGKALENRVAPCAAGALIYAVSRPGMPVPDFYATDEDAMADIRACAAESV